jgi:hypothetical protein
MRFAPPPSAPRPRAASRLYTGMTARAQERGHWFVFGLVHNLSSRRQGENRRPHPPASRVHLLAVFCLPPTVSCPLLGVLSSSFVAPPSPLDGDVMTTPPRRGVRPAVSWAPARSRSTAAARGARRRAARCACKSRGRDRVSMCRNARRPTDGRRIYDRRPKSDDHYVRFRGLPRTGAPRRVPLHRRARTLRRLSHLLRRWPPPAAGDRGLGGHCTAAGARRNCIVILVSQLRLLHRGLVHREDERALRPRAPRGRRSSRWRVIT